MPAEAKDEKQIISYLLGELSEAEQSQVEERFLRDAEYLETVRAVEDDLIDDYIRGELSTRAQARVENYLAASPRNRRKLEFARELSNVLDETPAATEVTAERREKVSWWATLAALFRAPGRAFQFATVALAAALALVGLWLLLDRRQAHTQLARLQAERQDGRRREEGLQREAAAERTRRDELARQLEGEREQRLRVEEQAEQLRRERERADLSRKSAARQAPAPSQASVATFVLAPGLTRGSDEPKKLVVPRGSRLMRLQLDLEAGDEHSSYRAELRSKGGNLVWSRDATLRRAGASLTLDLPAARLASGEYELILRGRVGARRFEDIGYYYFSIVKR